MATILLVDDDIDFRESLADILEDRGFSVLQACNGIEGLRFFKNHSVDLVISDVLMPDEDGTILIRKIKAASPAAKVIMISGGGRISADRYLEMVDMLGADDVLKKPFSSEQIFALIDRQIGLPPLD